MLNACICLMINGDEWVPAPTNTTGAYEVGHVWFVHRGSRYVIHPDLNFNVFFLSKMHSHSGVDRI
jgi:hypothetical protein